MNYNQECSFPKVNDTTYLQTESLLAFAGALGYEPVENTQGDIKYFSNPRAQCVGQERVSVNSMIQKHNRLPGQALRLIQDGSKKAFHELVATSSGEDALIALFAGYVRTVRKVKLTHSKRKGLIVQSHKIEFQTPRDHAQHKHMVV